MFVDFDHIYLMDDAFWRGALTVESVDEKVDPWALLDGRKRPTTSVVFRHAMGKTPMDLVRATHVAIDLISDRTHRLLREDGVTGWETYPSRSPVDTVNGSKGIAGSG